jgi:hypothetical protein
MRSHLTLFPVVAMLLPAPSPAAWGPALCAPVGAPAAEYRWVAGNDPAQYHLLRDGCQVGTWHHAHGAYYPYDGRSWGEPCAPPVTPPAPPCSCCPACPCADACLCAGGRPCRDGCTCVVAAGVTENYGIDVESWRREPRPHYGARGVPDDADKVRLTVIGADSDRRTVAADLDAHPALKALKEKLVVQSYPPSHWAVAGAGFRTDGRPTIYLQAPDGQVLHRQDDYAGGADRLAAAIRRADPNYDPAKDPDLTRPKAPAPAPDPAPAPAPAEEWLSWQTLAAAALSLLLGNRAGAVLEWLRRRREEKRRPPAWAVELQDELRRLRDDRPAA